jgi:TonB family protein
MRFLCVVGMLCLPLAHGVCQVPHNSLKHYNLAQGFLEQSNYQSAAYEFREALNGDLDPAWTQVWSHIKLGQIFDITRQHDRAVREYQEAQRTGDNTFGALDEVTNYLKHGEQVISLPGSVATGIGLPRGEPTQRTEAIYTQEARIAELEGTVLLGGAVDQQGIARDVEVVKPLGLGLDEKAIEAVSEWRFQPGVMVGQIAVDFRLSSKQSRWHLIQATFDVPPGTARPVFTSAFYPIGAGIGPDAMEEGRVLVAIGRLAAVKLSFEVDEHGLPGHFQVQNASYPVWGAEATAVVGQWRFSPGMKDGVAVAVPCTVELVWGKRELSASRLAEIRESLETQYTATASVGLLG